jgi:transposase
MEKFDARKLSEESLALLRKQAYRLRYEQGLTWRAISEITGVHMSTLMTWARRWVSGEFNNETVASRRRGSHIGDNRTLSLDDEIHLRECIISSNPAARGLPFSLWNRRAVQQAIKSIYKIDMPIRTVNEYLRRWGFTPQRPAKRAYEQRPAEVQAWLNVTYPAIARRAAAEGALIYWGDETAIRQDTAWARGYAPAGETPLIEHRARWESLTMISAITNQGLMRFAIQDGAINSSSLIEFLEGLIADSTPRKVFLILDNLRVHHSAQTREWLASRSKEIEVFYLPAYSPDANPDEYLNGHFKSALRTGPMTRSAHQLRAMAYRFMDFLEKTPSVVRSYVRHPAARYAM